MGPGSALALLACPGRRGVFSDSNFKQQIHVGISRREAPEVCVSLSLERGSRECRMRAAPAVSCAKGRKQNAHEHTGQRRTSDIPCAMALRLIPRSPRRRIRLVTVVGELTEYPRPVGPTLLRRLDTSNGCQNHTVLPYATTPFVCAPFDRSRVWLNPKPALQFTCALNAAASTASHPNVRDDGQRPFLRDRMAGLLKVICPTAKAKFCPSGYFVAGAAQQVRCGVPTFDRSSRP